MTEPGASTGKTPLPYDGRIEALLVRIAEALESIDALLNRMEDRELNK